MSNVFDFDKGKRERLVARGWRQVGGYVNGRLMWRPPESNAMLEELEAFKVLDRLEGEEKKEGTP